MHMAEKNQSITVNRLCGRVFHPSVNSDCLFQVPLTLDQPSVAEVLFCIVTISTVFYI